MAETLSKAALDNFVISAVDALSGCIGLPNRTWTGFGLNNHPPLGSTLRVPCTCMGITGTSAPAAR